MKKTLKECKEIVAKQEGYNNWEVMILDNMRGVNVTYSDLANKMYYEQSEAISLERAKKYARHQHYLGSQGQELVEFEDWEYVPSLPKQ